tara:strand:- start:31 stop:315 length:285 start_codon:yes stop_codon:yes gene_type:complete
MLVKYTMQEENSAGVEKTKEGGLYLPFSFAQSPDEISDKIGDTLFDIISKNKNMVLFLSFSAFFEGQQVLEGHFSSEQLTGEGRWISPGSETMH